MGYDPEFLADFELYRYGDSSWVVARRAATPALFAARRAPDAGPANVYLRLAECGLLDGHPPLLYTGAMTNTPLEGTKLQGFTPIDSVPTLEIIDLVEGSGLVVPEGATITAHYTGALVKDGTIFQSSHDFGDPVTFGLHQVINGWTVGVPGMKVGGTRRLVIPAAQAYGGRSPSSNIPPNSDLVFDIELVALT